MVERSVEHHHIIHSYLTIFDSYLSPSPRQQTEWDMQARRQANLCLWCKLPFFGLCNVLRLGVVVNVSLLFL